MLSEKTFGSLQTATFGGGCFWCLEAAFQMVEGVKSVVSGYAGGAVPDPGYRRVSAGDTGHAEVVRVEFDSAAVSYEDLLNVLWSIHDPTTLNRQGADVGSQYRSVIFYHDDSQRKAAEESIARLERSGVFADSVVTEVRPAPEFYPAEEYHRDYYKRNPTAPYCEVVIAPKLRKAGLA